MSMDIVEKENQYKDTYVTDNQACRDTERDSDVGNGKGKISDMYTDGLHDSAEKDISDGRIEFHYISSLLCATSLEDIFQHVGILDAVMICCDAKHVSEYD